MEQKVTILTQESAVEIAERVFHYKACNETLTDLEEAVLFFWLQSIQRDADVETYKAVENSAREIIEHLQKKISLKEKLFDGLVARYEAAQQQTKLANQTIETLRNQVNNKTKALSDTVDDLNDMRLAFVDKTELMEELKKELEEEIYELKSRLGEYDNTAKSTTDRVASLDRRKLVLRQIE